MTSSFKVSSQFHYPSAIAGHQYWPLINMLEMLQIARHFQSTGSGRNIMPGHRRQVNISVLISTSRMAII